MASAQALLRASCLNTVLTQGATLRSFAPAAECVPNSEAARAPSLPTQSRFAKIEVGAADQSTSTANIWYSTICAERTVPKRMNHGYFHGNRDHSPFGLWNHMQLQQRQSGSKNIFHNRTLQNATLHQNHESGKKTLHDFAINCIQIVHNLRKNQLALWEKLWLSFPRFMRTLWKANTAPAFIPTQAQTSTFYPSQLPHRFPQPICNVKPLFVHRFSPFSTAPTNNTAIYI